jgi:anti-sigma regulatory factor (Ser/Thr protein kinase)
MTHGVTRQSDPHLRLQMLSQPRYLSGARDLVAAVAKRLGFDDRSCGQIALAVDEALCNVMCHGYDRKPDGVIWLSLSPLEDGGAPGLRIVIEDEARQIDPARIKGRDLDDIRPGGLGVHIIREVMDFAEYEKRDSKGMRLTLQKRLPTEASQRTGADAAKERARG